MPFVGSFFLGNPGIRLRKFPVGWAASPTLDLIITHAGLYSPAYIYGKP